MKKINLRKPTKYSDQPFKRWGSLLFAVALVVIFMFIIAPGLMRITVVRNMAICIEESNIEATALWWSDVELFADAEVNCRNSTRYSPVKTEQKNFK